MKRGGPLEPPEWPVDWTIHHRSIEAMQARQQGAMKERWSSFSRFLLPTTERVIASSGFRSRASIILRAKFAQIALTLGFRPPTTRHMTPAVRGQVKGDP